MKRLYQKYNQSRSDCKSAANESAMTGDDGFSRFTKEEDISVGPSVVVDDETLVSLDQRSFQAFKAQENCRKSCTGSLPLCLSDTSIGTDIKYIDVWAPSGLLGLKFGYTEHDEDPPIILDLKDVSPLINQVNIGDYMIAVDDIKVSSMTVIEVQKLISSKARRRRKLTLCRRLVVDEKNDDNYDGSENGECIDNISRDDVFDNYDGSENDEFLDSLTRLSDI